jgi:hypothetical protein
MCPNAMSQPFIRLRAQSVGPKLSLVLRCLGSTLGPDSTILKLHDPLISGSAHDHPDLMNQLCCKTHFTRPVIGKSGLRVR